MECPSIFLCLQFLSVNSRQWNELWQCELSCILQVWMFMIPKSSRFKLHRYPNNCHQKLAATVLYYWDLPFVILEKCPFPTFRLYAKGDCQDSEVHSHSQDRAKFLCQWAGDWDFSLTSMYLSTRNLIFQSFYFLLAVKKKNKLISRYHPHIILTITSTFTD